MTAFQAYCARESAETSTLIQNEAEEAFLRDFLGNDPIRKVGCYMEGKSMSTVRLDVCTVTVIGCSVEKEKREGYRLEKYAGTYGKMVEIATRQNNLEF